MKELSQYLFTKDLPQYEWQFNTLKGLRICNCILLISEWNFVLHVSKNANGQKTNFVNWLQLDSNPNLC